MNQELGGCQINPQKSEKSAHRFHLVLSRHQSLSILFLFVAGFTISIFARALIIGADANDKCIGAPKTTVDSHHQAKQYAQDPQIKVDECGVAFAWMTSQLSTPQVASATLLGPETDNQAVSRSLAMSPIPLHSRPTATRKIYLDFDGYEFPSNSAWLSYFKVSPGAIVKGFSLDSNYSNFSTAENAYIEEVWRAVAEDFAGINVDVTTEDPGLTGLTRSSNTDTNFGAHALISDDNTYQQKCGCGGVAYVGSVDHIYSVNNPYSPSFNFVSFSPGSRVNSADAAGIVSHETGHNLGMAHDGTTTVSYYPGHSNGLWGTIMGTTYSRAISQWSKKEYRNARVTDTFTNIFDEWINNPNCMARPSCLDTFNVFAGNSMPLIEDDYGQTTNTAEVVSSSTFSFGGYIGSGGDEDWFKVSVSSLGGKITVSADPIKDFANLDIRLSILNSSGAEITFNDPVASRGTDGRPLGLNARIANYPLGAGTYFIRVRGTGALDPLNTGYSSYGSVGKYNLVGTFTGGSKRAQSISFSPISTLATTNSPYTLVVSASSGLTPVITSATTNICTVSSKTLSLVKAGVCTLIVEQAGDDIYAPANRVTRAITIYEPPNNNSAPTISGSAAVGQTLTATTGVWSGSPAPTYTYQWFACSNNSSTDSCSAITGATTDVLVLTSAQSGSYIRVRVTATNTIAATQAFSAASAAVGSTPSATGTLTVSGTASVGSTLTMNNGLTWSGYPAPEVATQWLRCTTRFSNITAIPGSCTAISGGTSATYTLTSDDSGKFIAVARTATSSSGTALRISASTATAIGSSPTNSAAPAISGSAAVGQTLTATTGVWSGSPTPKYTFQWFACSNNSSTDSCSAITGATTNKLALTSAQSGSYIRVRVTATNTIAATQAFSAASAAVG